MTRLIRRFAVMGLVAGLCVGVVASASTDEILLAQVAKGTNQKKKTKVGKKGTARPAMPDEADANPSGVESGPLKFSRDIAPILVANCAGCHKAGHRSGFDQTTFDGIMKGGKMGKDVVGGDPEASLLLQRIKGEETPKMPPGNNQLSQGAIAKIEQWIKEGAKLDPGINSADPIAKYAATPADLKKAELARLTPEQRDKKTEAAGRDRIKRAVPTANPEVTSSPHFLLFAEMPKDRATAVLKTMEAQHAKLNRLLQGGGSKGLTFAEKVSIYAFKDTKGFTEFSRTIENQDVEAGEEARAKLAVESPYITVLDPLSGGADPAATASPTRKSSRSKRDDSPGGPDRTLEGLVTEQLASGSLAIAGKPPRWLTGGVGALMASAIEPRSPYYRKLRAEAYEQYKEGWQPKANEALGDATKPETVRAVGFAICEWLASASGQAFPAFVQGMLRGGDKLDDTIAATLNGNREQFLALSGTWVEQRYGRGR